MATSLGLCSTLVQQINVLGSTRSWDATYPILYQLRSASIVAAWILDAMVLVQSLTTASLLVVPLASSPGHFWHRRGPLRHHPRTKVISRKRHQPFTTRAGPFGHDQAEELKCFKVFVEKQDLPFKAMIQSVVYWRSPGCKYLVVPNCYYC